MPTIEREGAALHYVERGTGPAVILQHALSADARSWDTIGVAGALEEAGFRVILPDALGHGRSGPAARSRVGLASRVQDILAVADAIGVDRFHYAGYSMGGWLGIGLLRDAGERLLSLAVAGWDPVDGARKFTELVDASARRAEFLYRIAALLATQPGRGPTEEDRLRGYADTYERLFRDLPSITTLITDVPLALAVGEADPYANPVLEAAESLAIEAALIPGNHVSAFMHPAYRDTLVAWLRSLLR